MTVDALDRIRTTLELLSEYGFIEWQGSLKETYDKYLKPSVLDYESKDMWELVGENKIISLFQFDTPVGLQCAKTIQPHSLLELAQANSLMRLMPEGKDKTPTEEFAQYKANPRKLFSEIQSLKATKAEKEMLYEFMKGYGGVLDSQESLMLAVMLPFTGYTIDEANKVRKVVAKKKMKEIEQTKQDYFARGHERGTSEDILHYIWDVQASRQMGYSFSIIHTVGYSTIAVQELNLAYKYPNIYWNTACLIVDSAGIEEEEDENDRNITELLRPSGSIGCRDFELSESEEEDVDEGEEEDEEGDGTVSGAATSKRTKKVVNYGKVSAAIGKMKQAGVNVVPPDINKSSFTFVPDVAAGNIIYGIKGITRINDEYAAEVINKRPYTSFEDFINRVKSTKLQIINLIKSGAFDGLEPDREKLMRQYIVSIAGCKSKLTLQNMQGLINYRVIPEEYNEVVKIYNFNKFVKKHKFGDAYLLDEYCQQFYNERFNTDLLTFDATNCMIMQKDWDKIYKKSMEAIRPFLALPSTLETLNAKLIDEQWDKYCAGPQAKWEMDSIGFYNTVHELDGIDLEYHDVVNFFELPEEPKVRTTFTTKDGKTVPLFEIVRIAGTVLERDKLKNIVTLLTPDGVVKVKIFKPQFVKYDRQLTERDEVTGKKKVMEKSWFSRGNKLVIAGIRRDTNFIPKIYKNYKYDYPIGLIDEIDYQHGDIHIQTGRAG